MRLTLHTDYTLRVLMQAAIADGKLITIDHVAKTFDVSTQHLVKVVHYLGQKGYLDTVRGRGGGIRLRRPPRDINIGQVVRETEGRLDVIGCLEQRGWRRTPKWLGAASLLMTLHNVPSAAVCRCSRWARCDSRARPLPSKFSR